jgi:hypothetical protein
MALGSTPTLFPGTWSAGNFALNPASNEPNCRVSIIIYLDLNSKDTERGQVIGNPNQGDYGYYNSPASNYNLVLGSAVEPIEEYGQPSQL